MAKASYAARTTFRWRYLGRLMQNLPLHELKDEALKQLHNIPIQRWSGPGGWLMVITGAAALLYWNGRLVLATGVGIGVMMLVYLMHDWQPDQSWSDLRKWLDGWNQPLALAIAGGGIATLTTYLATAIWADASSPSIALGAILQGTGTLAVLVLLIWQILHWQANQNQTSVSQLVTNLTHTDPLQRLIAIRQLTEHLTQARHPDLHQRRTIADYFKLMLNQEQEPIIRDALLDGLQIIDRPAQALKPASQPPLNVMAMKQATAKKRRRVPVQ
ncbi:hypothetical protein [Pantanalinema sp. GBBB05]|uniref:hypothetical protein n=1 Tax=Pantanalinema sp. GBBB05 TaxID=2604139 RepID=UPI001DE7B847|nr:hypothetical protein [Pantanalinema sp. GBBB05]